jgi:hypothetical protein
VRFAKTAAAAAGSRPSSDDRIPWTHAPADVGQGQSALGRWLRRWFGPAAPLGDRAGERVSGNALAPRPGHGLEEAPAPGPEIGGALPRIIPRRPGAPPRGPGGGSDHGDDPVTATGRHRR